jgi:hypothetical protein
VSVDSGRLVRALEAAGGSHHCWGPLTWLRHRADKTGRPSGGGNDGRQNVEEEGNGIREVDRTVDGKGTVSLSHGSASLAVLQRTRPTGRLWNEKRQSSCAGKHRLVKWEMDLESGLVPFREREHEQEGLMRRHQAAMVELVGRFHHRVSAMTGGRAEGSGESEGMVTAWAGARAAPAPIIIVVEHHGATCCRGTAAAAAITTTVPFTHRQYGGGGGGGGTDLTLSPHGHYGHRNVGRR